MLTSLHRETSNTPRPISFANYLKLTKSRFLIGEKFGAFHKPNHNYFTRHRVETKKFENSLPKLFLYKNRKTRKQIQK